LEVGKKFLRESGEALVLAAQGGDRVTILGGGQELFRCDTEGHG